MPMTRRSAVALLAAASAGVARPAFSATLPTPARKPVLTISGNIAITNKGDAALFDIPMLEALGSASFTTHTPWYDKTVTFEGVPMERVMAAVGAKGSALEVLALNDYATEIPMTDITTWHPLLALKRDGEYMPVRDKGPLFIVYNYDSDPTLAHQPFYDRSAWQVARIIVK